MLSSVVVLGIFVADTAFRAERLPRVGETMLGRNFMLGPGGKGSNQAVAAARAGAATHLITRLGRDAFGDMAVSLWRDAGVIADVSRHDEATGCAFIFVDDDSGDNAIIVAPGVATTIAPGDLDAKAAVIEAAGVFVTQLEQPLDAAIRGLEIARAASVPTILNPAPAADLPDGMLALCNFVTPNETETEALTGISVSGLDSAERAANALLAKGVGCAVITLGDKGVFLSDGARSEHVPARAAGPVVDTTGAGDAFNGGFAAALADGADPIEAARFGVTVAGIAVTRHGAAAAMPSRAEIDAALGRGVR